MEGRVIESSNPQLDVLEKELFWHANQRVLI